MNSVYLARQPILSKDEDICYYEILYRDADKKSHVYSNITASASVITSILNKFGTKTLLGDKKAFVKINFDVLASYNIAELITELHVNKIEVIATKIENIKTYELAKSVGCDYFEGYFFAKPINTLP